MWLKPVSSTLADVSLEIHLQKFLSLQHQGVRLRRLCGQIPWLGIDVSRYGQLYIVHVALGVHWVFVIQSIDGH
jgi:hypothetical protein